MEKLRSQIARALGLFASAVWLGGAASAQEFTPPRFEALEQQKLDLEQRRLDELETQRQNEIFKGALPAAPQDQPNSALRRLEIERKQDQLRLEGELERDQQRREETARAAALPNRRISAASVLVVRDPERYFLPPAPAGQYYARLDGRFVLVDAMSELVVKVLEPSPADPHADLPQGVRKPPQPPIPQ